MDRSSPSPPTSSLRRTPAPFGLSPRANYYELLLLASFISYFNKKLKNNDDSLKVEGLICILYFQFAMRHAFNARDRRRLKTRFNRQLSPFTLSCHVPALSIRSNRLGPIREW
jgi:hypothetical protein